MQISIECHTLVLVFILVLALGEPSTERFVCPFRLWDVLLIGVQGLPGLSAATVMTVANLCIRAERVELPVSVSRLWKDGV